MRLALIAFALIPAASTAAKDGPSPPTVATDSAATAISPYAEACPSETARIAKARKAPPQFHNLTDLPDANAYSAVFRTDSNGCPDPIVISYEVGKGR
jgi:hypothetical protein